MKLTVAAGGGIVANGLHQVLITDPILENGRVRTSIRDLESMRLI